MRDISINIKHKISICSALIATLISTSLSSSLRELISNQITHMPLPEMLSANCSTNAANFGAGSSKPNLNKYYVYTQETNK